ncbi:MAG: 3-isopropylmalate dehydratase small subunit [Nitrososphaerota archaeon]|nr:3-isopropylmalate dehydratase small subunit [Nitrososphaerota archaeon]
MPEPVTRVEGRAVPLGADDVDTDQIIPAQFLKVTEKAGLRKYLFYRWRYDGSGNLTGRFVLDRPESAGSKVLVAGRNFGIGSSRENAVWALLDMGITCVLASSFGDIFYNNSAKNGLLCVRLPETTLLKIKDSVSSGRAAVVVDLGEQTVTNAGEKTSFDVEPHIKQRLMSGMDDIALTTSNFLPAIERYEASMPAYLKPRATPLGRPRSSFHSTA